MDKATLSWLTAVLGRKPRQPALFERALTHASFGADQYERLEFLGDRVLGLAVADWLYELFPDEPEGQLSKRLNALVARDVCAEVARELGIPDRVRLGKQARDDGASDSDNVIGDVVEALIGALFLDAGRRGRHSFRPERLGRPSQHARQGAAASKSALQEWAAAQEKKPPAYRLASGPGRSTPRPSSSRSRSGASARRRRGRSKQKRKPRRRRSFWSS